MIKTIICIIALLLLIAFCVTTIVKYKPRTLIKVSIYISIAILIVMLIVVLSNASII